jgi:hypothetical protein
MPFRIRHLAQRPNPKTARQVSGFTSFKKESTMLDVVRKFGVPDKHAGSGICIFVYYMNDCSNVTAAPRLEAVRHQAGETEKDHRPI